MYYSGRNPLHKLSYKSETMHITRDIDERRLQKAFLRYHDEKNWPVLREALQKMGRADLIGPGKHQLIPAEASATGGRAARGDGRSASRRSATQRPATKRPVTRRR
jgi:hypothetical protein